jgi:formylglycine-generating enzyme required for sulfatase activity
MMGSPSGEKDRSHHDGPQHQVTLTKGFYMGKYEVTQAQWQAVMGESISELRDKANPGWPLKGEGENYPVYFVSWNDCQAFIEKLNQTEQGTYRLPTEAEWEYACRAGTTTRFYWGDDPNYNHIQYYAWYYGNNSPSGTKEVGQKRPNAFSLYDMSGNVMEWCQDWWGDYASSTQTDPVGPTSGSRRIIRGGSWESSNFAFRSAHRSWNGPALTTRYLGCRLVLSRTP